MEGVSRQEQDEKTRELENQIAQSQNCVKELEAERALGQKERDHLNVQISLLTAELAKVKDLAASTAQQVTTLQEINSRVQEYNSSLQQYNTQLQNEATKTADELRVAQKERSCTIEELAAIKGQLTSMHSQLSSAQNRAEDCNRQSHVAAATLQKVETELTRVLEEKAALQATINKLTADIARYRDCTGKSASELELLTSRALALEESYISQGHLVTSLKQQVEIGKHKLQLAETQLQQKSELVSSLEASVSQLESQLAEAEERIVEGENIRKKLHNTIQELKGNIRVFCRVRPLSSEESMEDEDGQVVQFPSGEETKGRAIEIVNAHGVPQSFTYDKVFGPEASQKVVFEEIDQLVQSALDGYKVCIFAYGQTGSGKTHTMLGQHDSEEHRGVIPRSLEKIFASSQALTQKGWTFSMQASMLEIYNENIRDLLANGTASSGVGSEWGVQNGNSKQYSVMHDAYGNTTVTDLSLVEVSSWAQVSMLLTRAAQSRSVGKTAMNELSSRSHCVFTLRIKGTNLGTEQSVNGILNLIDLAGSERLSRSAVTGDRLKETQAINKSLSSLGDVICSIANKETHIPYRNSKLTYLLQPCLGGEAKTLMFVNVAPSRRSAQESLCSLRFAAKVNACEIGVAKRNIVQSSRADSGKSGNLSVCRD